MRPLAIAALLVVVLFAAVLLLGHGSPKEGAARIARPFGFRGFGDG